MTEGEVAADVLAREDPSAPADGPPGPRRTRRGGRRRGRAGGRRAGGRRRRQGRPVAGLGGGLRVHRSLRGAAQGSGHRLVRSQRQAGVAHRDRGGGAGVRAPWWASWPASASPTQKARRAGGFRSPACPPTRPASSARPPPAWWRPPWRWPPVVGASSTGCWVPRFGSRAYAPPARRGPSLTPGSTTVSAETAASEPRPGRRSTPAEWPDGRSWAPSPRSAPARAPWPWWGADSPGGGRRRPPGPRWSCPNPPLRPPPCASPSPSRG